MLLAGSPFSKATRRISGESSESSRTFSIDHRRVHVGEQQPLAAARGIDQGDIDRPRRQRPPQLLLAHGRHQAFEDELAGFRLGQPDRRAEARLLVDGERLAVNGA